MVPDRMLVRAGDDPCTKTGLDRHGKWQNGKCAASERSVLGTQLAISAMIMPILVITTVGGGSSVLFLPWAIGK